MSLVAPGLDKEYMRDPGRPGVGVEILSCISSFVLLDANLSILISLSAVPDAIAVDRTITDNISSSLGSFQRFINIFSRLAIYY